MEPRLRPAPAAVPSLPPGAPPATARPPPAHAPQAPPPEARPRPTAHPHTHPGTWPPPGKRLRKGLLLATPHGQRPRLTAHASARGLLRHAPAQARPGAPPTVCSRPRTHPLPRRPAEAPPASLPTARGPGQVCFVQSGADPRGRAPLRPACRTRLPTTAQSRVPQLESWWSSLTPTFKVRPSPACQGGPGLTAEQSVWIHLFPCLNLSTMNVMSSLPLYFVLFIL